MILGIKYAMSGYATAEQTGRYKGREAAACGHTLVWTPDIEIYRAVQDAIGPANTDAAIVAALLRGEAYMWNGEGYED